MSLAASGTGASAKVLSSGGQVLTVPGLDEVIVDAFSGTDGTALSSHAPGLGGAAWTALAGSITIQSGVAVCQSATSVATQHTRHVDGRITCRLKCGGANANYAPSIVFRGTDSLHYLYVYFSGDGKLELWSLMRDSNAPYGPVYTKLAETTWSADTAWHTAAVTYQENAVTVSVDGGAAWEVTLDRGVEVRGTDVGVLGFVYGGQKDSFDDFRFDSWPGARATAYPGEFGTVAISDAFTGADGTRLNTVGWTEDSGTWVIASNKADQTGSVGTAGNICTQDAGAADFAVELALTAPTNCTGGLAFRAQDATHFVELELNNYAYWNGWAGFGIWYYDDTGLFYCVGLHNFQAVVGETYTLRLRAKGTLLIAECVEAGIVLVARCSQFTSATKVGLFEGRAVAHLWDGFEVRTA